MNCQIQVPTALPRWKIPPLEKQLDGPESRSGRFGEQINLLLMPGLGPRYPQTRSLLNTKY